MRCQQQRLEDDFAALGRIGVLDNGGYSRIALSPEDMEARNWLLEAMAAADLNVRIDAFGNICGHRPGREVLPAVMIGSHIDTVPNGGHYDGVIGVLAGLELVRTLNDHGVTTKRPIEIMNFTAEESSRFGMATLGSKALTGKLRAADLHDLIDADGISLYQALEQCGYTPQEVASGYVNPIDLHAFLEMHIEQGRVLEQQQYDIGIVSAIAAPTRFKVSITGQADHSGNTPMSLRRDALTGASELTLGVERIAASEEGAATVGTVGYLHVPNGAINVVPGQVDLGIDIRDVNMDNKNKAVSAVVSLMEEIAQRRSLKINWKQLCHDEPVALSQKIITKLSETATEMGLDSVIMPCGAGHDAMNMAGVTTTGLILIPCADGISHNPAEKSSMNDICKGADLLLKTVIKLTEE